MGPFISIFHRYFGNFQALCDNFLLAPSSGGWCHEEVLLCLPWGVKWYWKRKEKGEEKMQLNEKKFQQSQHSSRQVFFQKSKQVVRGDIETLKNHWTVYLRAQCIYLQLLYYIILLWLGILFFVWIIMRVKTCLFGAFRLIKERPKFSNSYILLVPSRIWRNSLTFCLKGYNVNG